MADASPSSADDQPPSSGGELVPAAPRANAQIIVNFQTPRMRVAGWLHNVFSDTTTMIAQTFNNLPGTLMNKSITADGVTIKSLPNVLGSADVYFQQVLSNLDRHQDAVPDDIDRQNIKHAFLAMLFVQSQLEDLVEFHGVKKNGYGTRMRDQQPRYVDKEEETRNKYITSLDLGARMEGKKGRAKELGGVEKQQLQDASLRISIYCATIAHLLGIKVTGYELMEKEELRKEMKHIDVELPLVAPPESWAKGMEGFTVNIPLTQIPRFVTL